MDQMRNELMQERSARQDLECDKISLERQVMVPNLSHGNSRQQNRVESFLDQKVLRWT